MNIIAQERIRNTKILYQRIHQEKILGLDLTDVKVFLQRKSESLSSFYAKMEKRGRLLGVGVSSSEDYIFGEDSLKNRVIFDIQEDKIYEFDAQKSLEFLQWELDCNLPRYHRYEALFLWYDELQKTLENNRGNLNLFKEIKIKDVINMLIITLLAFITREPLWQQKKDMYERKGYPYLSLAQALGKGILSWLELENSGSQDLTWAELQKLFSWWKNYPKGNSQRRGQWKFLFPDRNYPEDILSLWLLSLEMISLLEKLGVKNPREDLLGEKETASEIKDWHEEIALDLGNEIIEGLTKLGYWEIQNINKEIKEKKWNSVTMVKIPLHEISSSWFLSLPRPRISPEVNYKEREFFLARFLLHLQEEDTLSSEKRNSQFKPRGANLQANFFRDYYSFAINSQGLLDFMQELFYTDSPDAISSLLPYYEIPESYRESIRGEERELADKSLSWENLEEDIILEGKEVITSSIKNRRYQLVHALKASLCLLTELHFSFPSIISLTGRFSFRGTLVNPQGSIFQKLFLSWAWITPSLEALLSQEDSDLQDLFNDLSNKAGKEFAEKFEEKIREDLSQSIPVSPAAFFLQHRNMIPEKKKRKAFSSLSSMWGLWELLVSGMSAQIVFYDAPTSVYQIQGLLLDSPSLGLATGLISDGNEFKGFYQRILEGTDLLLEEFQLLKEFSKDFPRGDYEPDFLQEWSLSLWTQRSDKKIILLDHQALNFCEKIKKKFSPLIELLNPSLEMPWNVLSSIHFCEELFAKRRDISHWKKLTTNVKISKAIAMPLSYGITIFRMLENVSAIREKEEISALLEISPPGLQKRENFLLIKCILFSVDKLYPEIKFYSKFFQDLSWVLEEKGGILHWECGHFEWIFSMPERKSFRLKIAGHSLQGERDVKKTFDRKSFLRKIMALSMQVLDATLIFHFFSSVHIGPFANKKIPYTPLYDCIGTVPGASRIVKVMYARALISLRDDNPLYHLAKKYNLSGPWKIKESYKVLPPGTLGERVLR